MSKQNSIPVLMNGEHHLIVPMFLEDKLHGYKVDRTIHVDKSLFDDLLNYPEKQKDLAIKKPVLNNGDFIEFNKMTVKNIGVNKWGFVYGGFPSGEPYATLQENELLKYSPVKA